MNDNLNLVEILKDCPKGAKLYSPLFGDVEIVDVNPDCEYPIHTKDKKGQYPNFSKEGKYYAQYKDSECLLFPSKDQHDWSKFKVNKPKFDPNTLHPFDRVIVLSDSQGKWNIDFYSHKDENKTAIYPYICCGIATDIIIPYNDDTKHLVGTINEAPEYYRYWDD